MSKDISEIDRNLAAGMGLADDNVIFRDAREAPFEIFGLYDAKNQTVFKRIPEETANDTNEGVAVLNFHTSGGRIKFRTNSPLIAISAEMIHISKMSHMPLTGSAGFDVYVDGSYYKTFVPPFDIENGYQGVIRFGSSEQKDIIINFPLYSGVSKLLIGLCGGCLLTEGSSYREIPPLLFYGSSITQGGCASRPGNSYSAIISRMLNCDFINFGFSGSARGEDTIAEYMASQNGSVFVCDYDHNAPDADHLMSTHERLYKTFRHRQENTPVIFVSKPDCHLFSPDDIKRRDIIYKTYINAVNSGDRNVYFIDGRTLFGTAGRDSCTVDGCHPNDLGFMRMAEVIGSVIGTVIGL